MRPSFLPLTLVIPQLFTPVLSLPSPTNHGRRAHPARHLPEIEVRGVDDDINAAVVHALDLVPRPGPSAAALLATGQSVDLLPIAGNSAINAASYGRLTRFLPQVMTKAIESTVHSWEYGALVESLLEVYLPRLTPFAYDSSAFKSDIPWAALWVVEGAIAGYDWTGAPSPNENPSSLAELSKYLDSSTTPTALSPKPLLNGDGSLGDPASLGFGVWILARFASRADVRAGMKTTHSSAQLAWAVGNQLAYLNQGYRADNGNGTISMREGAFQVWSDMGSMIPPFPAYLGLDTSSVDLLSYGIDQWGLESSSLIDYSTNLYRHINDFDAHLWSTGNGWMLHGAVRVLASISAARQTSSFSTELDGTMNQMSEVFEALFSQLTSENLVPNYLHHPDSSLGGGETAGTAIIVAAYYRWLTLGPMNAPDWLRSAAAKAFDGVVAKIDNDGWLTQAVNPMGPWVVDGAKSPEGQSFVGMMWAARTRAGI